MRVILVTGGARSGKSRFAENRALDAGGEDVTYIATGVATDAEMRARIERHRSDRPPAWRTVEAPRRAATAVRDAASATVLLDCLTFLVSNALIDGRQDGEEADGRAVETEIDALLDAAADRAGELIIVTNEVGWGVVPDHELGRRFRDLAGRANQRVAAAAEEVWLLVAGIPLRVR